MITHKKVLITFEFLAKTYKKFPSNDYNSEKKSLNGGKEKVCQSRSVRKDKKTSNSRWRMKFQDPSSNK